MTEVLHCRRERDQARAIHAERRGISPLDFGHITVKFGGCLKPVPLDEGQSLELSQQGSPLDVSTSNNTNASRIFDLH